MYKIDRRQVTMLKLLAIRDQAAALARFTGGYNRGRASEVLSHFALRLNELTTELRTQDPPGLRVRIGRLRQECEQIVCPALLPAGRTHFMEDALVLLSMIRNVETYSKDGAL